jgi:hypothetical protein
VKPRLEIVPVSFRDAKAFVALHHRHHDPPRGHKFSVAVADDQGELRGVAMIGRPVARHMDDGFTLEVNRVATDGCDNACSALYGAAWRAARALGYRKLITYTLASEPGSSLRGAGWSVVAEVRGRSWSCKTRPRMDHHPTDDKLRWEVAA